MFVVVSYDIKLDESGAKVLQKTFKTCKKYLFRLQNSVFVGELSKTELDNLKSELNKFIRKIDKCDILVAKNINNVVHLSVSKNFSCGDTLFL